MMKPSPSRGPTPLKVSEVRELLRRQRQEQQAKELSNTNPSDNNNAHPSNAPPSNANTLKRSGTFGASLSDHGPASSSLRKRAVTSAVSARRTDTAQGKKDVFENVERPLRRTNSETFWHSWDRSPQQIYKTINPITGEVTCRTYSSVFTIEEAGGGSSSDDEEYDESEFDGVLSDEDEDYEDGELELKEEGKPEEGTRVRINEQTDKTQEGETRASEASIEKEKEKEQQKNQPLDAAKRRKSTRRVRQETRLIAIEKEKQMKKDMLIIMSEYSNQRSRTRGGSLILFKSTEKLLERELLLVFPNSAAPVEGSATVSSGSLEALLFALFGEIGRGVDYPAFLMAFLATHDYFIDKSSLLRRIQNRYAQLTQKEEETVDKQLKLIEIVNKWILGYFRDFHDDTKFMSELTEFLDFLAEHSAVSAGRVGPKEYLQNSLRKARNDLKQMGRSRSSKCPCAFIPSRDDNFIILDLHPLEVARQLTLIDADLFWRIKHKEYFRKAWMKGDNQEKAPSVVDWIAHFNKVCAWVATEIVLTPNTKQRTIVIQTFIDIAEHCLALHNFNAVMAIYTALNMGCITRLRRAFRRVSSSALAKLKSIETLMSPNHNFANYRAALKAAPTPKVPFQGVYLSDLTFIEENVDVLPNGWINFNKMYMLSNVWSSLEAMKKKRYRLKEVVAIKKYLLSPDLVLTEKQLYECSKKCEPSVKETHSLSMKMLTFRSKSIFF